MISLGPAPTSGIVASFAYFHDSERLTGWNHSDIVYLDTLQVHNYFSDFTDARHSIQESLRIDLISTGSVGQIVYPILQMHIYPRIWSKGNQWYFDTSTTQSNLISNDPGYQLLNNLICKPVRTYHSNESHRTKEMSFHKPRAPSTGVRPMS